MKSTTACLVMAYIRGRLQRKLPVEKPYAPADMPSGAYEEQVDLTLDLRELLRGLSERERLVCNMLREGHTGKEIALALGVRPQRVTEMKKRIADRLRAALSDWIGAKNAEHCRKAFQGPLRAEDGSGFVGSKRPPHEF